MKKRDPKKHGQIDKNARKRAAYEKARKLKQKEAKKLVEETKKLGA